MLFSLKHTWSAKVLNGAMVAVLVVSAFSAIVPEPASAAAIKVDICHTTGNGSWEVTPNVNESALGAHLAHGDFIIDENNPCPPETEEDPPVEDVCPNDEGIQTETPCPSDEDNEEEEENTEEDPGPSEEDACLFVGGSWDGESCSGITAFTICLLVQNEEVSIEVLEAMLSLLGLSLDDFECGGEGETDYCSTVDGIQDEVFDCPSQEELDCENGGGTWNDETDICTPADNGGGGDTTPPADDTNEEESSGGGGGGGSKKKSSGEVLGASTEQCSNPLLTTYLRMGHNNDLVEVVELQMFLMSELGLTNLVTGLFDQATKDAVEQFQLKYADQVLAPWVPHGLPSASTPTGYVYKTTQRMINNIYCEWLNIPMPELP
jgi:hypothetical protein